MTGNTSIGNNSIECFLSSRILEHHLLTIKNATSLEKYTLYVLACFIKIIILVSNSSG
ncbi:hypothetical protein GII40_00266 [Candidatus Profftia lariciata]|uniref:hypothetical protein n=1 Tax=Candidatus Profftia lariciata TaxID=1987921 RepID=UPI001D00CACA|nr:hypothetical protein [Candidatus Profftia lariciata]UDG81474.1 hypothetical protein GII40_00266 [Candidatus Profftia lariciata]